MNQKSIMSTVTLLCVFNESANIEKLRKHEGAEILWVDDTI